MPAPVSYSIMFGNQLLLPPHLSNVLWIKYDCQVSSDSGEKKFKELIPLPWAEFLNRQAQLDTSDAAVSADTGHLPYTLAEDNFEMRYRTDAPPTYWSSPDDLSIFFDSFDATINTEGMDEAFTQVYGRKNIRWRYDLDLTDPDDAADMDAIVPVLDPEFQTLLENEAIALAWAEKKQVANVKAEKAARRGMIHNQGVKDGTHAGKNPMDDFPDFGRRGRGGRGPTFTKSQRSGT